MQNKLLRISKVESMVAIILMVAFFVYFIPSLNHEIRIHDTFDGNFSTRHVLIHSGHFFDMDPTSHVPGIMNGLPRGVFPRFTEITSLLMYFFGSLNGFALTFVLTRLLAFLGIILFARDHIKTYRHQKGLVMLMATLFACLPFFIIHGLTVAGIPLVFWAFFNIYKHERIRVSYAIFLLFVLWSNFVLVGFHLILCMGLLALYFSIKDKKTQWPLFLAITLIGILYVVSDYMLFYLHLFNSDYQSSRGEMERNTGLNVFGVVGGTAKSFFYGDYSTANYFGLIALPFFLYTLFLYFRNKRSEPNRLFFIFMIMVLCCSFFINLLDWTKFSFFYEKFPFAKEFNFKRFTSLLPGLFFISCLIAVILSNYKDFIWVRLASSLVICLFFAFVWRGSISYNHSAFDTRGLNVYSDHVTTFNDFFDPQLYSSIKKEMGTDTMKNVISFGLSPSPAKYAGLNVLDDYQGDYPKTYKAEFRKIIEKELDKSEKLKNYFDGWGSRCYMESSNSFENTLQVKSGTLCEPKLDINCEQLKKMNCGYILSSIWIENSVELKIHLEKVVTSPLSFRTVFLYKLI